MLVCSELALRGNVCLRFPTATKILAQVNAQEATVTVGAVVERFKGCHRDFLFYFFASAPQINKRPATFPKESTGAGGCWWFPIAKQSL